MHIIYLRVVTKHSANFVTITPYSHLASLHQYWCSIEE